MGERGVQKGMQTRKEKTTTNGRGRDTGKPTAATHKHAGSVVAKYDGRELMGKRPPCMTQETTTAAQTHTRTHLAPRRAYMAKT